MSARCPSPPRLLRVHLLPGLTSQHELAGHAVAVIDVLRASTTIAAALAAGARQVVPCLEVYEARRLAGDREGALLGGERQGRPIPGFDLGNSPAEYSRPRVENRTVVFTTTNGTRALAACVAAEPVYVAAFVNLSPVCQALAAHSQVHLLCAGSDGQISREDVLLAGAIVGRLEQAARWTLNDAARIAQQTWQSLFPAQPSAARLAAELEQSHGGQNLVRLGMQADLQWAAVIDRCPILPQLHHASWTIRVGGAGNREAGRGNRERRKGEREKRGDDAGQ